jgi:Zn ribbon nucleic-acid-binding protein
MKCPFCESQDIRSYIDRDNALHWYLCCNCGYQGYDLTLLHDAYAITIMPA